jgi:alkylated DNA nucleotide flippase Atl1
VNASGGISARSVPGAELDQQLLLEREGIRFNARGRVPLSLVRWSPRAR